MNIDTMDEDDREDEYEEESTSTLEALIIQGIIGEVSAIVVKQQKPGNKTAASYEANLKSAETLLSLSQSALMLSDAGWIRINPVKIQGLVNRAYLESTLNKQNTPKRSSRPRRKPKPPEGK